ncbi:MAG: EamA family transporter [Aigarchaeota archaeon]|nr:EamA family transporter [Aigarchaeota archaeon]MDW8092376.1 EamA family transporter [Nitrososphaerota archaeon]
MQLGGEVLGSIVGLLAALSWGSGDFLGGVLSKRMSITHVVLVSQGVALTTSMIFAISLSEPLPSQRSAIYGLLAGLPLALANLAYYRALANYNMGLISPSAGILSAVLAVLFGSLVFGPPSLIKSVGMCVALAGISLASYNRNTKISLDSIKLTSYSGAGFGLFYVLFSLLEKGEVFWPLTLTRLTLLVTLFGLIKFDLSGLRPGLLPHLPGLMLLGLLDLGGTVLFVYSNNLAGIQVAAVLTSYYPLPTILLSRLILREKAKRLQSIGAFMTLIAVPLVNA